MAHRAGMWLDSPGFKDTPSGSMEANLGIFHDREVDQAPRGP